MLIWTLGHGTRSLDEFLAVLGAWQIEAVADVRRFPGSRKHPHFGGDALAQSLAQAGLGYRWLPGLGGRRRPAPDTPNGGWRNESFRGYADHLASAEFAVDALLELAARARTTLLCAETLWWRCHRALISDVLRLRGIEVVHIVDATHSSSHSYTAPARIVDGRLTYPAPATARGRIDFLTDNGAGIEVKVAGSLAAATRQLLRYAHSPDVRALLLVTTVAAHRGIPQVLAGVPVTLHSLTGQGLR